MLSQQTYHSPIYRHFKEIEGDAHRAIISFFDKNEAEIKRLEFEEYFELLVAYSNALFEVGHYPKHLQVVDNVIEASIIYNIRTYKGQDIYRHMLARKAAALYNTLDFDKANHVFRELIKIDPNDQVSILLLKRSMRRRQPGYLRISKAAGVFCFLLTALIIALEVLLIATFKPEYQEPVMRLRMGVFMGGWMFLGMGDLWHRGRVHLYVTQFVRHVKFEKALRN